MLKKWKLSVILILGTYFFLTILSFLMFTTMDTDFIGEWGLLSGFLLLLVALPLHKLTYFGGRGIVGSQSPEIPSDEPLHQKLHQEFENGNKRTDHDYLRLQEQSLF